MSIALRLLKQCAGRIVYVNITLLGQRIKSAARTQFDGLTPCCTLTLGINTRHETGRVIS